MWPGGSGLNSRPSTSTLLLRGTPQNPIVIAMKPRPLPDTAHLQHVNRLLEQALALPESEHESWLQALPAEHRALAPLLRALLMRASVETDTFMRTPVHGWTRCTRRS